MSFLNAGPQKRANNILFGLTGAPGFPVLAAEQSQQTFAAALSYAIAFDAAEEIAGRFVMVFVSTSGITSRLSISAGAGWSMLSADSAGTVTVAIFYKFVTGPLALTVANSASAPAGAVVRYFDNVNETVPFSFRYGAAAQNNNLPPRFQDSNAASKNLFIAGVFRSTAAGTIDAAPTGYSGLSVQTTATGASLLGIAYRAANSADETPDAFTTSNVATARGFMLCLYPANKTFETPGITIPTDSPVTLTFEQLRANYYNYLTTNPARFRRRSNETHAGGAGKYYFEFHCYASEVGGITLAVGIVNNSAPGLQSITSQTGEWWYFSNGTIYNSAVGNIAYGSGYGNAAVIGVAWDAATGKLWFAEDNLWQAGGDPAADLNPAFSMAALAAGTFRASFAQTGPNRGGALLGKASEQFYDPPAGFTPWTV